MSEHYQGALCSRGHDDGTGHTLRYRSGHCIACVRLARGITAPTLHTIGGRPMRTDGPLEHIVARNDVIYDAYWRDGDSVADLRHVFRIHRNYIGQIVFCRPGHPLSNRQQRSADG